MQYAFTPAVRVFLAVLFPNAVWGVLGPFPQKLKLYVQLATEMVGMACVWGQRDGSALQSICCSGRRSKFTS